MPVNVPNRRDQVRKKNKLQANEGWGKEGAAQAMHVSGAHRRSLAEKPTLFLSESARSPPRSECRSGRELELTPNNKGPFWGHPSSPARARLPSPVLTALVRNLVSSPQLFSFLSAISLRGPASSSTERCSMVSRPLWAAESPPKTDQQGKPLKPASGRTRGEGLHRRHQPAAATAAALLLLRPPRRKCVTAGTLLVGSEAEMA